MRSFLLRLLYRGFLSAVLAVLSVAVSVSADSSYVDDGHYDYNLSQPKGPGLISEYDIEIPMRDGIKLIGDLFRPDGTGTYPVIMAEAPYPRHQKVFLGVDDNGGVGDEHWYFEQANPEYWIPRGYIYISFNTRGYGGSEGQTAALDYQEYVDFYDAIEWAAAQPWCNGNIGLYGISYYAVSQYFATGLHPPHLKAIVPWEGLSDPYRDIGYRGGIPCMFGFTFAAMMQYTANDPATATEYINMFSDYPLMDENWTHGANAFTRPEGSTPALHDILREIDIPMLSVGNLNDPDLHLRGNVFAFREAISSNKKLLLYTGTHWGSAYQPWANRTVLRFFDHWLKGIDTGIEDEPAVDVQLRTGSGTFTHVYGDSWPLEQTQWQKYYMDARSKSLKTKNPLINSSAVARWAKDDYGRGDQITFLSDPLAEDLQIAGPLSAHFWVSASKNDVDLIVELRDFDENGDETRFAYYIPGASDEPVTRGWLRASLRALDPERSLPHQPFYLFTENDWLTPNEPVPVDVEIWPTSMAFKAGHRIGLTIHCGKRRFIGEAVYNGVLFPNLPEAEERLIRVPAYQTFSPNAGTVKIHTGRDRSSWLELPVIPADTAAVHRIIINDEEFTPATLTGQMGDRFEWTNAGEDYHSSTESSDLELWESQLINGLRSHNPETWWLHISWAGTFDYRDMITGFEGVIAIPDRVLSSDSASRQVRVELGLAPPPDGLGFDVQLQSGGGDWRTVYEGIDDTAVTLSQLSPDDYAVRSRLRRLDDNGLDAATGWSPPAAFVVK